MDTEDTINDSQMLSRDDSQYVEGGRKGKEATKTVTLTQVTAKKLREAVLRRRTWRRMKRRRERKKTMRTTMMGEATLMMTSLMSSKTWRTPSSGCQAQGMQGTVGQRTTTM